ncbi:MAG: AAA family ATPase [Blastocatellia bacterium]|nr:AAA family ATPase [Blastocatellia bacterium]
MSISQLSDPARDPFLEKGLPSNVEAERSILGAILLDDAGEVRALAAHALRCGDFYLDSHRRVFSKMLMLQERGAPIDLITLTDELRKAAEFEQVGGAVYIGSLMDGTPRMDEATLTYHARIIRGKALQRRMITIANHLLTLNFDEDEDAREEHEKLALEYQEALREFAFGEVARTKRLLDSDDLDELPPTEWLIPGHAARGSLTILYGPSGSMKSFYALHQMLCASQRFCVVYVVAEGQSGWKKRVQAWRNHFRIKPGRIFYWLDAVNMLDRLAVSAFIAAIKHVRPDVVVFDTLSRCMPGGDENSSKDMTAFADSCRRIQVELSAATWVIHHPAKHSSLERGHSSLRCGADVMIEIANDNDLLTVSCEKAKDEKPFDSYYLSPIKVEVGNNEDSLVLLPAAKVDRQHAPIKGHALKILEALNLPVFEEIGARANQIVKAAGVPDSSLYRVLGHLKGESLISQSSKGEPYFITERGRDLLSTLTNSHSAETSVNSSGSEVFRWEPSPTLTDSHSENESSPLTDPLSLVSLSHPFRGESSESEREQAGAGGGKNGGRRKQWRA